jgi:hypothetical protein
VIDIVLRPRCRVKLSNQKILHWYQDFDLVTELRLERMSAMYQCGTQFLFHRDGLQSRVANAEVVPHTEPHGVRMLVRLDADPAPVLCHMLDRSPSVQMATEQARQAATKYLDDPEPLALVLENPRGFTDHGED